MCVLFQCSPLSNAIRTRERYPSACAAHGAVRLLLCYIMLLMPVLLHGVVRLLLYYIVLLQTVLLMVRYAGCSVT